MGLGQRGGQEVQEKIGLIFQIGHLGGRRRARALVHVCLERELISAQVWKKYEMFWLKIEKSSKIDHIMPKGEE
jgi:hypothetical protein